MVHRASRRRRGGLNQGATCNSNAFTPVDPTRILDTRDGTGLSDREIAPLAALEVVAVTIPGAGGVPSDEAVRAVTLSVTVANAATSGYITVFPCDLPRPVVSNVNFDPANAAVSNLATVRPSSTGKVCVYVSEGTDVVADLNGYYTLVA